MSKVISNNASKQIFEICIGAMKSNKKLSAASAASQAFQAIGFDAKDKKYECEIMAAKLESYFKHNGDTSKMVSDKSVSNAALMSLIEAKDNPRKSIGKIVDAVMTRFKIDPRSNQAYRDAILKSVRLQTAKQ